MSTSTAAFLDIRSVRKQFGDFWALKDVSLSIDPGEFICFLGPSGCGKTTLLRTIAGLETLEHGHILQQGKDVSKLPPSRRDFGIVFQSYALFPNLTVAQNVGYGLQGSQWNARAKAKRVSELLDLVGLAHTTDQYPAQLSGGMQQRVALARALANSPGLLLLDEPLSALDARVRAHLRSEIRQLHNRLGITTIMVTHDQEEALSMADRIVVMNHGVIEQVGTPQEVYLRPTNAFVADFVGRTNPMSAHTLSPGWVDWDGIELACEQLAANSAMQKGQDIQLSLRPEDIRLMPCTEMPMPSAINTLDARVQEVEFLGSFCRVALKLTANNRVLLADVPTTQAQTLELSALRNVQVHLCPQRLRAYATQSLGGTRL